MRAVNTKVKKQKKGSFLFILTFQWVLCLQMKADFLLAEHKRPHWGARTH